MKHDPLNPAALVEEYQDVSQLEREAQGIVEMHDFIKDHPDIAVKEIARFLPPVDARVVSKGLQLIAKRKSMYPVGKLIITRGLPRSGKTTWAKEFVAKSGNAVRINRDDLRAMLHNGKWSHRNEEVTMAVQKAMVLAALKAGKVVVVDDTNLGDFHKERWANIAKEAGSTFESKTFSESDLTTLIERDTASDSVRGSHVIIRLALENCYVKFEDDSVVLCDIDGTIANLNHRLQYAKGETKDWDAFFSLISEDTLIESTKDLLVNALADGKTIIFVSARPERCRADTEAWLLRNGMYNSNVSPNLHVDGVAQMPYFALLMRPDGDSRDDTVVKQNILDNCLDLKWIHKVIDDRPRVIEMWRKNGLTVVDVGHGVDF